MQQNPQKLIINRIVIGYHEYQSMIGKLINIEYVANLQSCPKFPRNLEMKPFYYGHGFCESGIRAEQQ